MGDTDNLIRSTDFAVYIKGRRGEWIPYPESGKIFSTNTGEFLKTSVRAGYHTISITFYYGGQKLHTRVLLHRALWVLCNGLPFSLKAEVDHIDGDRENNVISNLRLISSAENCRRRLTYADAEVVREKYASGRTMQSLAEEYLLSPASIRDVVRRRTYKHPPETMPVWRKI